MLSPKMQRTVRVNDSQLVMLSDRAHYDHSQSGYLHKRTADSGKWQLRWFVLYQNLLFYYETEGSGKPSGVLLLEGCYCERLITSTQTQSAALAAKLNKQQDPERQYCFAISYRRENQRQYELRAQNEQECSSWISAIRDASFNKLLMQKEELEQKHLHLLQVVESEKTAKWQYTQHCEELASEIKKLRAELCALKKEWRPMTPVQPTLPHQGGGSGSLGPASCGSGSQPVSPTAQDNVELRKIKKVQSFFRGWLCRRRWKQIVEQYIKSPHAESMRKRNSLVFRMVEAEEEYMEQMEVLVSCFLRPFKMAASSKRPPCSHEDVNSIFLNSETVLFLHQIFLKGLTSRLESWPTLVLGDLFDMLLPMLSIYQEYVRNHHYSLQVLTECKGSTPFAALLSRLEAKPACQGRSLEAFLTYPMHQIPRYIITLHELLAHTPHDHVERRSLQNARQQLEDLSRQMHDEVSETENLRKNLAVERMIVEGCDILLDVNQVFVRQGSLVQLPASRARGARGARSRLASFKSERDILRQCFLFSNHLIIATRTSGGRLHLVPDVGKIPLADALLIEDPSECSQNDEDAAESASVCSMSSQSSSALSETSSAASSLHPTPATPVTSSSTASGVSSPLHHRDFKIILDGKAGGQLSVHLVAPTVQDKAAWISDISQCMDNAHLHDLLTPPLSAGGGGGAGGQCSGASGAGGSVPHALRADPRLFRDDVDIRFSRTLNSCKVPQIRYATPERLLQRLTDLRFLSIDFLNTFLLTYRVFTDGETVLGALQKVFYTTEEDEEEEGEGGSGGEGVGGREGTGVMQGGTSLGPPTCPSGGMSPRRVSGASSVSGYCSEGGDRDRSHSVESSAIRGLRVLDEEGTLTEGPRIIKASPTTPRRSFSKAAETPGDGCHLTIPKVMATSSSSDTLTEGTVLSGPSSPGNLSSVTLVGSTTSDLQAQQDNQDNNQTMVSSNGTTTSVSNSQNLMASTNGRTRNRDKTIDQTGQTKPGLKETHFTYDSTDRENDHENDESISPQRRNLTQEKSPLAESKILKDHNMQEIKKQDEMKPRLTPEHYSTSGSYLERPRHSICSLRRISDSDCSSDYATGGPGGYYTPRGSLGGVSMLSRPSLQHESPLATSRVGVVITSSRQSQRRSSTSSAAAAFAIATSASSNPRDVPNDAGNARNRKESVLSSAATMRVLNVLRHWVSKHSQDFEQDARLRSLTISFLDDITYSPNLLPAEHRAAAQLLRLLCRDEPRDGQMFLAKLLAPSASPSKESIETLSALEIAEQMTYLDHQIFMSIRSEEFLGQAWMKADKATRAPHILLMTRRFNDVSRLVVSEIVRRQSLQARTQAIEKWAAVADISRCLHNFNGVLQVCAAFTNSSVFRLKKTWEKVSKTTRQTIAKLQGVVSSDGRFRVLRDALHRCDPPCIPYLGLYLTDLSFIEEGTPDFTPDGLLNFSKMRMIAHVIREIRHFQQTPYKIDNIPKVTAYLLDASLLLDDDELYRLSLQIEPRTSRLGSTS